MEMVMEYVDEEDEDAEGLESSSVNHAAEGYVVTVLLTVLSVTGTAGNALVLYVFSRRTDRLVSTLFILSLAVVDFTTCCVVVPYTVYMEYTGFHVDVDFLCKLYHFLVACNVPFSAMVMVAIAIDRYFCICHPWLNVISSRAAKRIVAGLGLLAVCIGCCVASMHGIYHTGYLCRDPIYNGSSTSIIRGSTSVEENDPAGIQACNSSITDQQPGLDPSSSMTGVACTKEEEPRGGSSVTTTTTTIPTSTEEDQMVPHNAKTSVCAPNDLLLSFDFQSYYHKVHNSIYAVCFFAVVFLYVAIYRSVLKRRRKRQRLNRRGPATQPAATDTFVVLTRSAGAADNTTTQQPSAGVDQPKVRLSLRPIENSPSDVVVAAGGGDSPRRFQTALSRLPSYDGNFVANMRTAAMLFVVTVVFVMTFLPAWLMIMNWLSFSRTVFYLYFANNTANPVIYSFMNRNFRESVKRLMWRNRAVRRCSNAEQKGLKRSKRFATV